MTKKSTTAVKAQNKLKQMGIETEVIPQLKQSLTLLKAFECLYEQAKDSKLNEKLFIDSKFYTDYIQRRMGLTAVQAMLFAIILNGDRDDYVSVSNISRQLECSNLKLMSHYEELDQLELKGLIMRHCGEFRQGYRVHTKVIESLKKNLNYERPLMTNLTTEQVFVELNELFSLRDDNNISTEMLHNEIMHLYEQNPQLVLCEQMKKLSKGVLKDTGILLLTFFAHKFYNDNDEAITMTEINDLFDSSSHFRQVCNALRSGQHPLLTHHLIEHNNEDGMFDGKSFKMSDSAKQSLLAEASINIKPKHKNNELIASDSIKPKEMFYNPMEHKMVDRLQSMLDEELYTSIVSKLMDKGLRTGFTCLLYGGPGTGKTETALQLARLTGRDIMQVQISEIKSKWVGDSEKNIKDVFERYRRAVKNADKTPILLFNEADGILGVRHKSATREVDKMSNAIQNIILQEMENLEGIMIATTNLTSNLDKAFERRFLYKIKFEKPTLANKCSIWKSLIPELSDSQALELATAYDFSGGQIENVSRKKIIDDVLYGIESIDMEHIKSFCDTELIDRCKTSPIGFRQ